ncbi:MAG: NADH-quinone oxidoreductase subunit G [Burkholderiaceae bacterium]|nr:NADH-quinone oxidoreductase subunit G [Burkholderiaceae bacterium]
MIELEIDGQKVEVPEGSMVMDAATKLGLYVPHFCYHKKLSIAANCRMCLVEVEKAPKALPACATPVTAGMKVFTASEKAKVAQKSVMEFLLINHPLDCPICDQGGECQLQDLAVGYGPSASRYTEEKRVVFHKSMGPLISAEEMSRCIHCTRCVRFGQEIAGVMELGMAGRGEHSEIMSFVGNAVESELSGNMIDVCPVGALTSKPFRYSARTWELSRKRSVSPHDSIGANIVVQSKNNEVKRVVPLENEEVNECWISDRDRFSYEGLNSADRLTVPMIRHSDGQWHEASWEDALAKAAGALRAAADHGPNHVRTLLSPNSTLEELSLSALLTRALKSDSVDFRPRLGQTGFDGQFSGVPTLGMALGDVSRLDRALVIGAFLRQDQPLIAQRLRQAVRHGARVATIHASAEDLLMPLSLQVVASPADWVRVLAEIAAAALTLKSAPRADVLNNISPSPQSRAVAQMLAESADPGAQAAILLGNSVLAHPQAASIWGFAQMIADSLGCRIGFTVEGGNGVGGYVAKARPIQGGLDAASMFASPGEAYLLVNIDPLMDCANPQQARAALTAAKSVVALTAFKDGVMEFADVVLPIAPYTETSGSYVNCEGRLQTTQAVVRPRGQARPGWKILRVLGNLIDAEGFEAESSEDIRQSIVGYARSGQLLTGLSAKPLPPQSAAGLEASAKSRLIRIADVPIYRSDAVGRHAEALQQTRASAPPKALMHSAEINRLGLANGARVKCVQSGRASVVMEIAADDRLAPGVIRISAAHATTAGLADMIGPIELEAA